MKVLSSSVELNIYTIAISTTPLYLLNFKTRRGKNWTFNHIWMTKFTSKVSHIIVSTFSYMVSLKWKACTSSYLKSQILQITTPPLSFLSTQNATLIQFKWTWKFFVIVFSHNQYCGYTMLRVTLISTSENLQNNSKQNFVIALEHATFTMWSIWVSWWWCTWM
jgi:hypothetical protein